MLSFESDYTKGAHVRILERLLAANGERNDARIWK